MRYSVKYLPQSVSYDLARYNEEKRILLCLETQENNYHTLPCCLQLQNPISFFFLRPNRKLCFSGKNTWNIIKTFYWHKCLNISLLLLLIFSIILTGDLISRLKLSENFLQFLQVEPRYFNFIVLDFVIDIRNVEINFRNFKI